MKKFLDALAKGKRGQENCYNLYDASIPDNVNNHFTERNIFKHYPFDSNACDSIQLGCKILLESKANDVNDLQESPAESVSKSHSFTSKGDLPQIQQKNNISPIETNGDLNSSVPEEKEKHCKSGGENKSRKNVYMINISNSKCFHIGSQKTINIIDKPLLSKTSYDWNTHHSLKDFSSLLEVDFQNLLDSEERLFEKYISVISQHVKDQWEEFLEYLGFKKNAIETLKSRNNNNRILCVYDALCKYKSMFPNTSLGFVIYVLSEIHQVAVIEMLAQKFKL